MRRSLIASAAAVLVLSFGVAACGSSDDSGESPGESTLTKSELITEADAICSRYNGELANKVNKELTADSTEDEAVAFVSDEIVPLYRDEVDELRDLNPDEADSAAFNKLVDTLESELTAVEDDPSAMLSGGSAFPEATKQAKDFGLEVCGSGNGS